MFTNSEESGKVSSAKETQDSPSTIDEVLDSPIIDISAPSSNSNVSELPQIIKTSDVSRNVNSPETSPFTGKFESKATPEGLQEDEKVKSSSEKDLKVFSTNDNSASNSDTTASYETVETTALSEPTFRGNKQLSATTELKQLAVPSDVTGFTNDAFELEVFQKKDDTQVCLIMGLNMDILFYCINRITTI
jgi:hypothetical protein